MGKPAARLLDMTMHGGIITSPGCPTVLIGKMPAARMTDMHVCPMITPPAIPHVGMLCVGPVPPTVLIGKLPAACMGDMFLCVGPPATVLPPGCPTVMIGMAGGGGGGGGGGGATAAAAAKTLTASKAKKIKGLSTEALEVEQTLGEKNQYTTPTGKAAATGEGGAEESEEEEVDKLTIADFVEILEAVEREEGYEAARFFASYLDYGVLTQLAKDFTTGKDANAENDPNQMPTRFMLLYGADDAKLQTIDDHPDRADGEEHKINVANLRKGLRALGYEIAESGAYDEEVYVAHVGYIASNTTGSAADIDRELTEEEAVKEYLGKKISEICPNNYHNNDHNHCAHFVSHAKNITIGYKCRNQTGTGPAPGASIRVHELFAACGTVGKWDDKPADLASCLAFVTSARNVNVPKKTMENVPEKHVGILDGGDIYHYSNTKDEVVKQTPAEFKKHYSGTDIEVFYGTFPQ